MGRECDKITGTAARSNNLLLFPQKLPRVSLNTNSLQQNTGGTFRGCGKVGYQVLTIDQQGGSLHHRVAQLIFVP